MSVFDIVLLVVLLLPALIGLFKGLVNLGVAFVGTWAAVILARLLSGQIARPLADWLGDERLAAVFAYAAVFSGTFLVAGFLGWLLTRSLKKLDLQWVNRLGGAGLGLATGVLLAGLAVGAVDAVAPSAGLTADSVLAGPLRTATGFVIGLKPPPESADPEAAERPADASAAPEGD